MAMPGERILTPTFMRDADSLRLYSMDIRNALSARAVAEINSAEAADLGRSMTPETASKKRPLTQREIAIIEIALCQFYSVLDASYLPDDDVERIRIACGQTNIRPPEVKKLLHRIWRQTTHNPLTIQ